MARLCERPGCSEHGAIAYGFDAVRTLVWLAPLDPDADRNRAGTLCVRHADSMVVPLGWTLEDARDPMPRLFRSPGRSRITPLAPPVQLASRVKAPSAPAAKVQPEPAKTRPAKTRPAKTPPAKTKPARSAKPGRRKAPVQPTRPTSKRSKQALAEPQLPLDPPPETITADPQPVTLPTVVEVTGKASAPDDPDATVAIPWMPEFDINDDLGGMLHAESPLLARAFRGVGRHP